MRRKSLSLLVIGVLGSFDGLARAATEPPLPPALDTSLMRIFHRVGLAIAGDATPEALAARREVEEALRGAGHDVVIRADPVALPPGPAVLADVRDRDEASALVVVQTGAGGAQSIWVSLYNAVGGARLFTFSARLLPQVVPLAAARPAVDLRLLPLLDGPDFYRALGRPDLASRYEARQTTKVALRSVGFIALVAGVLWGIADLVAVAFESVGPALLCELPTGTGGTTNASYSGTNSACQNMPQASGVPWLIAAGGLGLLIASAVISPDPLNPTEKRALIDSVAGAPPGRLSLSVSPAPVPNGAALVIGGRF